MQIRQNQSFSAQTLRTHRHLFWECWGVVLLGVLLWLLEFFAAALLLRIQGTPPASLLTEQAVLWRIVQVCWLVPAWLAWTVCRWRLWYHCTGAVSLLPRCRPAGTGKRLVLALQNTLLRTLLLQTVTLCLFGAYQLGQTAAHRTEGAPYLFWAVQQLVLGVLCLLGWVYVCLGLSSVVCALCLLCPSGTAALESARCRHADHARRSAGTAGTAGVVCPANAAAGDAPVGAAESGAVGDGVLQSAVPSVV